MYHKRGTEEKKQEREKRERKEDEDRREKRQEKTLTKILATVVGKDRRDRGRQLENLGGRRWQEPRRDPEETILLWGKTNVLTVEKKDTGPVNAPRENKRQRYCPSRAMTIGGTGLGPPP